MLWSGSAEDVAGVPVLANVARRPTRRRCSTSPTALKGRLPGGGDRARRERSTGACTCSSSVAPELVAARRQAGAIVKARRSVVGGGGGGRDTLAQAGGRDPEKLGEAIEAARSAIAAALEG